MIKDTYGVEVRIRIICPILATPEIVSEVEVPHIFLPR